MAESMEDKKLSDFPSDFISPEQKASKEYALKWCEAIEDRSLTMDNGFFRDMGLRNRFAINRAYARGEQSVDKLKPMLGVSNKKVRNDAYAQQSYKALSWENLGIMPKFINVLMGKLMKQNNDIGIQAIDKRAQDARRQKRMELREHIINGPFLASVTAKTGIPFQAPVGTDVIPAPESLGEVDMHMNMFYKEEYCLAVQDLLKEIGEQDNYVNILAEVARDLTEVGIAATRVYRVGDKILRRHCHVERMGSSSTMKDNFTDVKYTYEDWDLTIGQLKEIAGDQFTEEEYKEIAEKATSSTFDWSESRDYYNVNYCYPWDNTKIVVKDCVWFSPDWKTYQVDKNSIGNAVFSQKEYDWWKSLEDRGVTEESFNAKNASQVIRYPIDNQYQAMWIKNTKFVFNYGLSKDMLKNESTVGTTISPFTVYKLKKCPVDLAISVIDNMQINWIQYQHHNAKSRPAGLDIEFSALQDISLSGAAGDKMKPKEVLQMYFDTGILLWRRKDAQGHNNNWRPIQELQNGISPAAAQHFQNVVNCISLLRDMCGLNELTDASTPNSEMGKAVATMASGASEDALRPMHFAFDQINLGTQERTVMHITGMAATGLAPHYTEAIGIGEMATVGLLSDLTHHQLGCYLQKAVTDEERMYLNGFLLEGTKPGGYLYPEEAMEISREPNIYRAIKLLKMYRTQKTRQAQQQAQQDIQANTQAQIQSAQAALQGEMEKMQMEHQMTSESAWADAQAKDWLDKQMTSRKAFLLNLEIKAKTGQALTEEEARRVTELQKVELMGQYQLQVAALKPKPKPPSSKK